MRRALATVFLLGTGVVAAACGNKAGEGGDARTTAATATAAPPAKATATAAPSAAPAQPPPLPAGRSAAPTLAEWNGMKKEVTVKGSSALKCETKIVREYLRVSCKEAVEPEGKPTAIKILKGGRGEALAYANDGVISLILPYVEGTDFEAAFSWTKKSHKLVVSWPKGARQPAIVGTFEGAASPLDGSVRGDDAALCACHKKVTGLKDCSDVYGAADADCDRTYAGNCSMLLACARGEPSAAPRCLPGFINGAGIGRCFKECGPGKAACLAGWSCIPEWGTQVCWEN
jgi:hypothetical protein